MKTLGITFDNVLNLSKQNNYMISQALNLLKLNGYNDVDIDYDLILNNCEYLPLIYKNGFNISSIIIKSNLTTSLNVIRELNAVDFCLHSNLNNVVINLEDFIVDENALSILKKNLRRIVKYANNFGVVISVKNSINLSNIYTEEMLLDLVKSVKGLKISLDICALYKANKTPFKNEEIFYPYVVKVYVNDLINNENTLEYCSLFNGITNVIENIKNFKKYDKNIDFTLFSILENYQIEKILINSAINYLMEINYGQD